MECKTHKREESSTHCIHFCNKDIGGARHLWVKDTGAAHLYWPSRPDQCIGCGYSSLTKDVPHV